METKRSPGSNIELTGISEFFHAKHTWGQTSVCFVLDDADVLLYLGKTKSLNLVANSLTSSLTRLQDVSNPPLRLYGIQPDRVPRVCSVIWMSTPLHRSTVHLAQPFTAWCTNKRLIPTSEEHFGEAGTVRQNITY